MNQNLYGGVIAAIDWMRDHIHEYPELLTILTALQDGEREEWIVENDTRTAIHGLTDMVEHYEVLAAEDKLTQSASRLVQFCRAADRAPSLLGEALANLNRHVLTLAGSVPGIGRSLPNMHGGVGVKCTDDTDGANFLKVGAQYTVDSIQTDSGGNVRLNLRGMARAWEVERFTVADK